MIRKRVENADQFKERLNKCGTMPMRLRIRLWRKLFPRDENSALERAMKELSLSYVHMVGS